MRGVNAAVGVAVGAAVGVASAFLVYRARRRVVGPWLLQRCTVLASTITDRPIAPADDEYTEVDVRLSVDGLIEAVAPAGSLRPRFGEARLDCRDKFLLPGFVNAHTHSTEMLSKGLIPPTPLDLWVLRLLSSVGEAIGHFRAPNDALQLAALHCAVESLLGGCTSVLDHCYVGDTEQARAVVAGYREVGVRAFFAPMLGDDSVRYENYIRESPRTHIGPARGPRLRNSPARPTRPTQPAERLMRVPVFSIRIALWAAVATDAAQRNARRTAQRPSPEDTRGLGCDGCLRLDSAPSDPEACASAVALWEDIVNELHRPESGVSVVIGPVTAYSCSAAMLEGAARLRRKHQLHGHIHLLESRGQKREACRRFGDAGAVGLLERTGFLHVPGTTTSCAHACWLEADDMRRLAAAGAAVVTNPLSNLRLGSGVCQVRRCREAGVDVAIGCDGACSSDGQDLTEAIKATCLVSALTTPEYREWLSAREALRLAYEGGSAAVGLRERAGKISTGRLADLTLWDLTSLSMLPQNDPASTLALCRPQSGPSSAGSALDTVFVGGRRLVARGDVLTVNLRRLRAQLWAALPRRRPGSEVNADATPDVAFHQCAECEYRAALNLDGQATVPPPAAGARLAGTLRWDPFSH